MKTTTVLALGVTLLGASLPLRPVDAQKEIRRVTLDEALQLFGRNNLQLVLARARAAEAVGLARQAKAYPNPVVAITHEALSGAGTTYSESYFNLSQRLEWPWVRSSRVAAAAQTAAAIRARLDADSARLAFEVKRAYVEAAVKEELLQTVRRVAAAFRRAEASGAARFAEGDISGYALRRLRLERARYENMLGSVEIELHIARRVLSTLILPEAEGVEVAPEAAPTGDVPQVDLTGLLAAAQARRAEILAAVAEVAAARADVALHRRARLPDPTLTGGYKRQSDGQAGAFLGLALPLPLFNRRSGQIQAVDARLSAAEGRLAVAQRHIDNDVRTTHQRYTSLAARVELLHRQLLTGIDDLLDIAQVSYAEGEMTLLELLDAAEAFRVARVTTTELEADYWVSYYDLERAAGGFPAAQQGSKTDEN